MNPPRNDKNDGSGGPPQPRASSFTFQSSAFGQSLPARPSSAGGNDPTRTRLRQKPAFGPPPTTTATTTAAATAGFFSSERATGPPRSTAYTGPAFGYSGPAFGYGGNGSSYAARSTTAPTPTTVAPPSSTASASAAELFSMDDDGLGAAGDDDLGDEDGWGIDSPSAILQTPFAESPVAAVTTTTPTAPTAAPVVAEVQSTTATSANAEDEFSWVDEQPLDDAAVVHRHDAGHAEAADAQPSGWNEEWGVGSQVSKSTQPNAPMSSASVDLGAVLSPASGREGEFWGEGGDDDLFGDQGEDGGANETAEPVAPTASEDTITSPPLPELSSLSLETPALQENAQADADFAYHDTPELGTDGGAADKTEWEEDWPEEEELAGTDDPSFSSTDAWETSPAQPAQDEDEETIVAHHEDETLVARRDDTKEIIPDESNPAVEQNSQDVAMFPDEQPDNVSPFGLAPSESAQFVGSHAVLDDFANTMQGVCSEPGATLEQDSRAVALFPDDRQDDVSPFEMAIAESAQFMLTHTVSEDIGQVQDVCSTGFDVPQTGVSMSSDEQDSNNSGATLEVSTGEVVGHSQEPSVDEISSTSFSKSTADTDGTPTPGLSFGSSSFGVAALSFGGEHNSTTEVDSGSVISFADTSSAGATFGGSEDACDSQLSADDAASETSVFGSSSVGTAFVTEPPTSSDGQASVGDSSTFDHANYESCEQPSNGTSYAVDEIEESSHFDQADEAGSNYGVTTVGVDSRMDAAGTPRDGPSSVTPSIGAGIPHAFVDASHQLSKPIGENVPESQTQAHNEKDDVNPFSSSDSSGLFVSSPFAQTDETYRATEPEVLPSADSLFGSSPPRNSPNPFNSYANQAYTPAMDAEELPTSDAGDLFASAPSAPGFAGYYQEPVTEFHNRHGSAFSTQSMYGNEATSYNYDSTPDAAGVFGAGLVSSPPFGSSQPSAESVFGSTVQSNSFESTSADAVFGLSQPTPHGGRTDDTMGFCQSDHIESSEYQMPSSAYGYNHGESSTTHMNDTQSGSVYPSGNYAHQTGGEPLHTDRSPYFQEGRDAEPYTTPASANDFFGQRSESAKTEYVQDSKSGHYFSSCSASFDVPTATGARPDAHIPQDDTTVFYGEQPSSPQLNASSEPTPEVPATHLSDQTEQHLTHAPYATEDISTPYDYTVGSDGGAADFFGNSSAEPPFGSSSNGSTSEYVSGSVSKQPEMNSLSCSTPCLGLESSDSEHHPDGNSPFGGISQTRVNEDWNASEHMLSNNVPEVDGDKSPTFSRSENDPFVAARNSTYVEGSSYAGDSAPGYYDEAIQHDNTGISAFDGFAGGAQAADFFSTSTHHAAAKEEYNPQQPVSPFNQAQTVAGFCPQESAPHCNSSSFDDRGYGESPGGNSFSYSTQSHYDSRHGATIDTPNQTPHVDAIENIYRQQSEESIQNDASHYSRDMSYQTPPSLKPLQHPPVMYPTGSHPPSVGFTQQQHSSSFSEASPVSGVAYQAPEYSTTSPNPVVMTSSKYKDPTMVAPSCLVSFGFGGNVVTMFPKRKLRLNAGAFNVRNSPKTPLTPSFENTPHGELRKGPVSIYRMEQLHPRTAAFDSFDKFPGPLTENTPEDFILQHIEEKMKAISSSPTATHSDEDERLLLGVFRVLIKNNGRLRSDHNANPSDPNSPEVQLVSLLKESDQRRRRSQASSFPAPKPVQYPSHPDTSTRNANRIRELLLLGDRKAAVDVAIQSQMWPEAMLIASFTDKDEYKRVLCAYFTTHYSPGDPCRALYLSFADQQEKSVHEPQKLMQFGQEESSASSTSSVILSSWVIHVQMLLANRTADTNKILIELGDRLWKESRAVVAAHVCYLLAGLSVEAPTPNSKIALIGSDHRTPSESRFYVSPAAVQRTEIYEWLHKKANASATNMIPFQGYKLIYSMILADHGKLETSFKYVNSMLSVLRTVTATMKPGSSMYLEGMQNQLTVLDDRLRQHLGQDRAESVAAASSKQGKWGFGSALSIMGKIVNRVVEGNDAPPAPSGPPSSNGGLFQGAPRSNNSNAAPEYPSASSAGAPTYPVSQGPPSSNGRNRGPQYGGVPSSGFPQSQNPPSSVGSGKGYSSQPATPAPLYSGHTRSHGLNSIATTPASDQGPVHHQVPAPQGPPSGRFSAPLRPSTEYASTHGASETTSYFGSMGDAQPPAADFKDQHARQFEKPRLDLSGDAGKGSFANESAARRSSEHPGGPPKSPRSPRDGPGSDKGSASPKFKDTKKAGRSKTPPPSRSSSGWLSGLSTFIAAKMNPEAKVAKLGEQMEAYFDEEKKRWVFPGETQAEEPTMPSAPPTGPLPGSTPGSSSGGPPMGGGPPGTHSAPGSIAGGGAPADDPLAALMAPPPARAHASLMKKDPLAAMMAPPSRPGYGQRASTMPAAGRRPPRPQFAVFKPAPSAANADVSGPPDDAQGPPQ